MTDKQQTNLYLDKKTRDRLEKLRAEFGIGPSAIVSIAIADYYREHLSPKAKRIVQPAEPAEATA